MATVASSGGPAADDLNGALGGLMRLEQVPPSACGQEDPDGAVGGGEGGFSMGDDDDDPYADGGCFFWFAMLRGWRRSSPA